MSDRLPLAGLRVLVLEDEYFIADDVRSILKRAGAESVRLSGSIDDAMRQIKTIDFAFALFDINIHGEISFALADEFARRDLSFAFISGANESVIPSRFATVPNWGKSYDDRQIVAGIQALWKRPMT